MTKTIVITGSNSGIGKAAAIELAKEDHRILMLCRSKTRGKDARNEIISDSGNSDVELYLADLADFSQIKDAVANIRNDFNQIDVLINNAGVILMSKQFSEQGIEKTIAVNHFGHFLLTDLLFPIIENGDNGRIINTSSGAHYSAHLNFDDINYEENSYSTFGAYGRSKLANLLFTYKLDRILQESSVYPYAIHPGFVGSNFATNNGLLAKIVMILLRPFAKSPKSGAQPLIYLAGTDGIEKHSGKYFVDKRKIPFTDHKIRPRPTSKASYDETLQDLLWVKSRQYIINWDPDYEFNIDPVDIID